MSDSITVTNVKKDQTYKLTPVPMSCMPSDNMDNWRKFIKNHISGSELTNKTIDEVQSFMRKHKTECLTDGKNYYTIAGDMLAFCNPNF